MSRLLEVKGLHADLRLPAGVLHAVRGKRCMVRRRAEMNKAGIEAGSLCGLLDSATGSAQEFAAPC